MPCSQFRSLSFISFSNASSETQLTMPFLLGYRYIFSLPLVSSLHSPIYSIHYCQLQLCAHPLLPKISYWDQFSFCFNNGLLPYLGSALIDFVIDSVIGPDSLLPCNASDYTSIHLLYNFPMPSPCKWNYFPYPT